MRRHILVLLTAISLILSSCGVRDEVEANKPKNGADLDISLSLWTAYWHTQDLAGETLPLWENFEDMIFFAAYFDADREIFVPEATVKSHEEFLSLADPGAHRRYLSFVNDLQLPEGGSSLKDRDLLYSILGTEEAAARHIEDILDICAEKGFNGIEIDYEALGGDMVLWGHFVEFIEGLCQETNILDIPLRVVLEPRAPMEKIDFPAGPEYVIMCYNLHGPGTEPGPKADGAFIEALADRAARLPGKVNFALATGGFDFRSDGEVDPLTERDAAEIGAILGISPGRDADSRALILRYTDPRDLRHEIWYADAHTLRHWIETLQSLGHRDISLWKIGGNLTLREVWGSPHTSSQEDSGGDMPSSG